MNIRKAEKTEYSILADIHQKAFNNFFLTTLGKDFLRTYYKASLKSSESVAFCALNDKKQIVGFCIACTLSKGYHKRLIKNNLIDFLFQGISILLTRPKALFRLVSNLDKSTSENDDGNYAELLSIAVSPNAKGMGIGKDLVSHFEAETKARGCQKVALTTDYFNNEDVIAFYKKSGYKVFCEFTTYPNRKMFKMIKNL